MGVGGREKKNVPQSFYSGGYVRVWTVGPNFPTSIIKCVFIQHSLPLLCFKPFSRSLLDCSSSFYTLFFIILICLKSHFTFLFPLISLLLLSIALLLHVWKNFPLRRPRSEELNTQAPPSQIQNTAQDY